MVEALGHRFTPYGGEEMMCRPCGFVIWPVKTPAAAEAAVRQLCEHDPQGVKLCGGAWHVFSSEART